MNNDERYMREALKEAKKAYEEDEIPVGAVIVYNNKIIARGHNTRETNQSVLGHAEISSILKAEKKIRDWRLDGYSMIVTLEPCNMCSMIIKECRLDNVYYFLPKKNEDISWEININKEQINDYKEYTSKFKDLLTVFFNKASFFNIFIKTSNWSGKYL